MENASLPRIVVGKIALALVLSVAVTCGEAQDKPATPVEQFQALLKQAQAASSSGRVLSDAERLQFIGHVFRVRNDLALRFLELAEQHPTDPIAIDALCQAVWQVNTTPWPVELVGKNYALGKAFAVLQRDHIRSDKLGPLCQRISGGFCEEYETFLRRVLEVNPHRDVRATACLSLAHFLNNRLQRLEMVKQEQVLAQEFEGLFGREYLTKLQRQDRSKTVEEVETLFEQAGEKYADVTLADGGTVGQRAAAELFEIRHLSVGKIAPDIEGEDQDGKEFKLSDYRGKVVFVDFWSQF